MPVEGSEVTAEIVTEENKPEVVPDAALPLEGATNPEGQINTAPATEATTESSPSDPATAINTEATADPAQPSDVPVPEDGFRFVNADPAVYPLLTPSEMLISP